MKEVRYLAIILFATSGWLGCPVVVLRLANRDLLKRSSETQVQNSFPRSAMRFMGTPNRQIQWLKMAEEMVEARVRPQVQPKLPESGSEVNGSD
jgi:hypothetical protein